MTLLTQATASDRDGDWRDNDRVRVVIGSLGGNRLHASVNDFSSDPQFSTAETFTVGRDWILRQLHDQPLHAVIGANAPDGDPQSALLQSAARKLVEEAPQTPSRVGAAARFGAIVGELEGQHPDGAMSLAPSQIARAGRAIADLTANSHAVVSFGTSLRFSLYGLYQGGSQVGRRLIFQRMSLGGDVVTDASLSPHYDVR